MKTTGSIKWFDGKSVLMELDRADGLAGLDLVDVTITKHRKRRSLDANAYYYVLATKIAAEYGISLAEYHNRTLAELYIPWVDDNGEKTFVLMRDNDTWLHSLPGETHFAPTTKTMTDKDGNQWRWFCLMKPSRAMDSKEMATLIDYVVQDAETLGIETKTDKEIERLIKTWAKDT